MAPVTPVPSVREGYNAYNVNGQPFHVPNRYVVAKSIGQGAYGIVCAAQDLQTGRNVAIKKICKVFECLTDAVRTLREIKLLHHFKHENIVGLEDVLKPLSYDDLDDIYIVNDLMDTDLHQIINSPQPLTDDHVQYFVYAASAIPYQILRGLKYIHSGKVLHRDLKPSNLLINGNCDLKICDFGLARVNDATVGHEQFMTQYVATRWYRAPEVILSWKRYTEAIDMWAVGCIFAELLTRQPLFPGKDYINQVELITNLCGSPTAEDVADIRSEKARRYLTSLPFKPRVDMKAFFPQTTNPLAIDLLDKILQINPDRRISTDQALAHPYFESLHDPNDEPFDFEWERAPLSKELVKSLLFKEMVSYHPELFFELDNPLFNPNHADHSVLFKSYVEAGVKATNGGLGIFAQPAISPNLQAQIPQSTLDMNRLNQELIQRQLQEWETLLRSQPNFMPASNSIFLDTLVVPPREPQDLDAQLQLFGLRQQALPAPQQRPSFLPDMSSIGSIGSMSAQAPSLQSNSLPVGVGGRLSQLSQSQLSHSQLGLTQLSAEEIAQLELQNMQGHHDDKSDNGDRLYNDIST